MVGNSFYTNLLLEVQIRPQYVIRSEFDGEVLDHQRDNLWMYIQQLCWSQLRDSTCKQMQDDLKW